MDRYEKVMNKKKEESSKIEENEIRITSQGLVRNYISYATSLLHRLLRRDSCRDTHCSGGTRTVGSTATDKNGKEVVLKGMGKTINKAVSVAEIIKRRIPRLHQDTVISSVRITDVYEPLEEGLCNVEQTRNISMITITLSTEELTKTSAGYQAPSSEEQPRSRYNNQQQPRQALRPYNANSEDANGGERDIGQGRGNYRGRFQNYQENEGNSNQGQGGGSGRGSGYNGNGNGRGRGGRRQTSNRPRSGDNQA